MRAHWLALASSSLALAWCGTALAQSTPPGPPPPAPSSAASSLSTGGLAPPPAVDASPAPAAPGTATPASTEAALDRADREDSGRGLEFVWLNAEVGVMHLGLATFHDDHLLDPSEVKTNETGVLTGAGLGVRLVFVTVGARFRYAPMPDYKLWSLALEGGIHAPFGALEPYGTLDLGYVSLGSFPGKSAGQAVHGFDARLSAGLDYYLTNLFSVGIDVSGDLMLLERSSLCTLGSGPTGTQGFYCDNATGNSTAGAVTATVVGGLHF
jgi:hypothetical protein